MCKYAQQNTNAVHIVADEAVDFNYQGRDRFYLCLAVIELQGAWGSSV